MTGGGNIMLTIPRLSSSFEWTAQEVSKLGKSCIYILSDENFDLNTNVS